MLDKTDREQIRPSEIVLEELGQTILLAKDAIQRRTQYSELIQQIKKIAVSRITYIDRPDIPSRKKRYWIERDAMQRIVTAIEKAWP